MTSYPICTLSPYHFHENTTTIPDISPAIFDITATVSVSSHRWHTPLYRRISLLMTSQQVCKSSHLGTRMTSYPIYIPSHSHYMTSMIMFNVIKYKEFMTSDLLSMTSYPFFRTSHHFVYDIKSTVSVLTSTASVSSHPTYHDITATTWKVLHAVYL